MPRIPVAYLDRWTARPGEPITLHASCERAFELRLVRVFNGGGCPEGPPRRQVEQQWFGARRCDPGPQRVFPGSYAVTDVLAGLDDAELIELELWFRCAALEAGRSQTLASLLDVEDAVALRLGLEGATPVLQAPSTAAEAHPGRERTRAPSPQTLPGRQPAQLRDRRWYKAVMALDLIMGRADLAISSAGGSPSGIEPSSAHIELDAAELARLRRRGRPVRLLLAAAGLPSPAASWPPAGGLFNGKLEAPRLSALGRDRSEAISSLAWKLGPGLVRGGVAMDDSGQVPLRVVNAPTDAVTGHHWDGSILDFTRAPSQYGALAFHDDDLEDAGWPPTAVIELPADLASGVYAAVLAAEDGERRVPFFVAPAPAAAARPQIAVVLPTFTYLAYANEHVREDVGNFKTLTVRPSRQDLEITEHRDFGLSLYDRHRDGTGVCYSSTRRPVLNFDPDYRFWLFDGPVHLGEDLLLLDWLDRLGYDCDVLTDHLVDAEGAAVLEGYRVVILASHPEYVSLALSEALEGHVAGGGRLMYLGGNGHYWVCSTDRDRPHVMEIRRGHAGGRTWEGAPGEGYHSTTGEPGGLWRYRGRPPNRLFGVGFAAQGADEHAPGYRRVLPAGEAAWEFVFEGLDDDQAIGGSGLLLGGAAGNEVDRADASRGSPHETVVLATSTGHSDAYQLAVEDLLLTAPGQGGTEQPLVRSDLVVVPYESGGCVFSVGAITWLGALAWNGYANDVARLTRNVLERFLER
jgi:N,N-dimethylformamidase